MASDLGPEETAARLSPEEAFSVLGDETRLTILRTLGDADDPLVFSDLFARVDYDDPSNFNYHLKKLTDHFVHKTADGYVLRQAGRRVVEAVLAEVPADETRLPRTRVDQPCFLCGAPVEVSYRDEHVGLYCAACGGTRDDTSTTADGRAVDHTDVLGYIELPPAGVVDRTPQELLEAASVWTTTGTLALARGVCSGCSAPVEKAVTVCEDHVAEGDRCDACGQRFAVSIRYNCTNCTLTITSPFSTHLLDHPDLIAFMTDHEIDLLGPNGFHMAALEETVLSTDPFEARFTFTADGESIALTVADDLSVVGVTRYPSAAPE